MLYEVITGNLVMQRLKDYCIANNPDFYLKRGMNINMKVVVAPDSFKGNLSAVQVAEYIEAGSYNFV